MSKMGWILAAALSISHVAQAQSFRGEGDGVPMRLTFEGGAAHGVAELSGPIEVLSWSWGASSSGLPHQACVSGGACPGAAGTLHMQDLSLVKYVGPSTPRLAALLGKLGKIQRAVLQIGNDPETTLVLRGVIVASITMGGSRGEERMTETISLSFEELELGFTSTVKGKKGTTREALRAPPQQAQAAQ